MCGEIIMAGLNGSLVLALDVTGYRLYDCRPPEISFNIALRQGWVNHNNYNSYAHGCI